MTTVRKVSSREIADAFAAVAAGEPLADRLWLSEDRGDAVLWLLTRPADLDEELRLYSLLGEVYDRFPEARVDLHLINPRRRVDNLVQAIIPASAAEIPLRRP